MSSKKIITTLILAFVVLFAQVGNVAAAPQAEGTTCTVENTSGTVQSILVELGTDGTTVTVLVSLGLEGQTPQDVRISLESAIALNLIVMDATVTPPVPVLDATTGLPVPVTLDPALPLAIEITPDMIIAGEEAPVHPISALLGDFFCVEKSLVDQYHTDGFGFGLIAQALWMSKGLEGAISFDAILDAKKSGDYSAFASYLLPNGSAPTNWGQLRKALLDKKQNLGVVVSGDSGKEKPNHESDKGAPEKEKGKSNGKGHGLEKRQPKGNK
jgi:hypothetical protein